MLRMTLLCNAGLMLECEGAVLMTDVPNCVYGTYYVLPPEQWRKIMERQPPYDGICGFYFTHNHPDHCNLPLVRQFQKRWLETPVFLPEEYPERGKIQMGPFQIEFHRFPHAPLPQGVPPHVVSWITAGEKQVYLSADAALDCQGHRDFLKGREADAAFWNAMYLSRPETRNLLTDAARQNYIYHMPADHNDPTGMWRKCGRNFERYGEELKQTRVLGTYPSEIVLL